MEEKKDSLDLTIQKLNILSSSNIISYTYKQVIDRAVDLLIEQRELIADYDKIIDALDSVTWYNGLAEIIVQWKNDDYFEKHNDYALLWDWDTFHGYHMDIRRQLEVIWMICVCMFGNYGTSPRTGWIELKNKEAFFKFVDDITATYREDLESH